MNRWEMTGFDGDYVVFKRLDAKNPEGWSDRVSYPVRSWELMGQPNVLVLVPIPDGLTV